VRFFDPATGREVRSVPGGRVVALSPDGKVFVRHPKHDEGRVDRPSELVFGDAATGRKLHRTDTLIRFGLARNSFAYTPDGRSLMTIPPGGEVVEIWDAVGREKKATLRPAAKVHQTALGGPDLGFTPDGKTVWALVSNRTLARWEAATGNPLPPLDAGRGVMFHTPHPLPDGKTILTTCGNGPVRVWDADTLRERQFPTRFRQFAHAALSPDATVLAVGDSSGKIGLFDAATGRLARTVREAGEPVASLTFSPDRELLAVEERDNNATNASPRAARVLRASDGKERWSLERKLENQLWSLAPLGFADGDTDRLIVAHYPRDARVWNLGTGAEGITLPVTNSHATPSPDGKVLATDDHGEVVLLDTTTGKEVRRIEVDPEEKRKRHLLGAALFAWSADGRTLATTLPADHVAILDPAAGTVVRQVRAYTGDGPGSARDAWQRGAHTIRGLSLSGDGKRLAVAALNGSYVAVWDTATG
jgi:WD40 repeat protein